MLVIERIGPGIQVMIRNRPQHMLLASEEDECLGTQGLLPQDLQTDWKQAERGAQLGFGVKRAF